MSLKQIYEVLGVTAREFHEQAYERAYGTIREDRVEYDYQVWRDVLVSGGYDYLPGTYQKEYYKLLMRRIKNERPRT